jgi:CBS domain-containing protein
MHVQECMKKKVFSISPSSPISDAIKLFVSKHIGTLPVIDSNGKLIGLLLLRDIIGLVLPDFIKLISDIDFVHEFGAIEENVPSQETLMRQVSTLMHPPVSVESDCGLVRAFSVLNKEEILDLPVVDGQNLLVGIISSIDIGTAYIANWNVTQGGIE